MVNSLYTTRPGEQEALYFEGQPVVELREEVQEILDIFSKTHSEFPHIYLAEPVSGRDGTTDWYGRVGDVLCNDTEKGHIGQVYQAVCEAVLAWTQTKPENIDPDLLKILPLALSVPSFDFLQQNTKNGLVLAAWGHRSLSGWLEKGDVFGKVPPSEWKASSLGAEGIVCGPGSEETFEKAQSLKPEETAYDGSPETEEKLTEETIQAENFPHIEEEKAPKEKILYEKEVHIPPLEEIWWRRPTVFWPMAGILLTCFTIGIFLLALALGPAFALFLFPLAILCLIIWLVTVWLRKIWGWVFAGLGIAFLLAFLFWLLCHRTFFSNPEPVIVNASPIVAPPVETVPQTPLAEKEVPLTETNKEDVSQLLDRSHLAGGASGAMEIILSWEGPDDLDLHVMPPNGAEISFTRPQSDGGVLDVDANANPAKMQAHPLEHVVWAEEPPVGPYNLMPVFYRSRNNGKPAPYHLDVYSHGKLSHEYQGTLKHQGDREDFAFEIFPPDQKESETPKEQTPKMEEPDISVKSDEDFPEKEAVSPPPPVKHIIRHHAPSVSVQKDVPDISPPSSQEKWDIQGTSDHSQNSFGTADVPESSGLMSGASQQSSSFANEATGKGGTFGKEGDIPSSEHSKGWEFSHKILGMKHSE